MKSIVDTLLENEAIIPDAYIVNEGWTNYRKGSYTALIKVWKYSRDSGTCKFVGEVTKDTGSYRGDRGEAVAIIWKNICAGSLGVNGDPSRMKFDGYEIQGYDYVVVPISNNYTNRSGSTLPGSIENEDANGRLSLDIAAKVRDITKEWMQRNPRIQPYDPFDL